ncbi:MAG: ATP-binding protein [Planctomycetota bacterium]|nr:ATP-binding protein [Planctomycetota bacterium]
MIKMRYVHRQIEPLIRKYASQFPAVLLTGPRQSGKSTTLKKIFSKKYKIISFDDPFLRERALTDPKLFLENLPEKVLFDEIQYAPQILSYLKINIDRQRQKRGVYIMTGSQQFNLMKGLTETLAGRVGALTLLPFNYQEVQNAHKQKQSNRKAEQLFINACLRGSFPEIIIHPKIDAADWYGGYLTTYLERDIRSIYNIGSLREFQRFMQLLASRCSQILNLSNLANDLGVAVNTVKNWISVLEASQIIYLLSPYYQNVGKRISRNPKVYFLDCGLVCYLTGITTREHLLNGPMAGALFENYCIQETVKLSLNKGQRPNIFYLRTHNGLEIDLLIERNLKLYPVEIKLTKSPSIGMANSIERFSKVFSKLKIMPGKVICLIEGEMPLTRTVSARNLLAYLQGAGKMS